MRAKPSYSSQISPATRLTVLLCLLFASMVAVELLSRAMHDRRNVTLRIEDGLRSALRIRPAPESRQVLFAGNSLVFDDLSQPELQQSLGPGFLVHTAGVPGSTYDDWRYGLRALYARGSRPDVIVFSISPSQFLRQPAATSLPVSVLWRNQEILAYQRDEGLNLEAAAELLLQRYSTYFTLKDTIRIYLRKFIPGFESLASSPSISEHPVESVSATEALFSTRLSGLLAECRPHSRLVLMISPTNQAADERLEPYLRAAAEDLDIAVIEPVAERQWPLTKFREDQYHLTPPAAAEYSRLVATDLLRKLSGAPSLAGGQ